MYAKQNGREKMILHAIHKGRAITAKQLAENFWAASIHGRKGVYFAANASAAIRKARADI